MNQSPRICHLSDLHLGYRRFYRLARSGRNQRELDVLSSAREVVDRVTDLSPDVILLTGDFYHSVRPSNFILAAGFRLMRTLARIAPVVIIAGRNDTPRRAETGSPLQVLGEIAGVYPVFHRPRVVHLQEVGVDVCAIPFGTQESDLNELRGIRRAGSYLVLMGYGDISAVGKLVQHTGLPFSAWDYVALGGVHKHSIPLVNAAYAGAPDYTTPQLWSEAGIARGFVEVTLPGPRIAFHKLLSPRQIIDIPSVSGASLSATALLEKVEDVLASIRGGIEGKLIRIEFLDVQQEALKLIDHRRLKELRSLAQHMTIDFRVIKRNSQVFAARQNQQPQTLADRFRAFYRAEVAEGERAEAVENIVLTYLARAAEQP